MNRNSFCFLQICKSYFTFDEFKFCTARCFFMLLVQMMSEWRKLRFELLKTTLMAVRGFKKNKTVQISDLDLNLIEYYVPWILRLIVTVHFGTVCTYIFITLLHFHTVQVIFYKGNCYIICNFVFIFHSRCQNDQ